MKLSVNSLLKVFISVLILLSCILLYKYLESFIFGIIGIIIPFLIAFTISFIVSPWIKYLEKKNVRHNVAVLIVIIFLLSLLVLFSIFLVPLIGDELNYFIDSFPAFIDRINELFNSVSIFKKLGLEFKTVISYFIKSNSNLITKILEFVTTIFSSFIPTITTPILIVYFIIYYDRLENWIRNKAIKNDDLYIILREIKISMHAYFKSYLIITILLSFFSSIAFWFLDIDYFIIWGLVIGITNIIPYIGQYIGGIIVGLYVLASSPELLVYVIIIIVCLQIIESNFLTPKIQGDVLEINPILVVFSVTLFGKLLGIFGMIIAVPIIRIIQIVVKVKKINKKR
ncbi:MAG: AI-2E family transporter [Erysipelotrichaceae bacterium]|nr:AI-2E family transporter [Erysipelotrichaceae bacterium]